MKNFICFLVIYWVKKDKLVIMMFTKSWFKTSTPKTASHKNQKIDSLAFSWSAFKILFDGFSLHVIMDYIAWKWVPDQGWQKMYSQLI